MMVWNDVPMWTLEEQAMANDVVTIPEGWNGIVTRRMFEQARRVLAQATLGTPRYNIAKSAVRQYNIQGEGNL